jgi:hypothetical protein
VFQLHREQWRVNGKQVQGCREASLPGAGMQTFEEDNPEDVSPVKQPG